jgi:uncharacterized membrane protein YfhO
MPNFYGTLNAENAWNKGLEINHDGLLQGDFLCSMLILLIVPALFLKKSNIKNHILIKNIGFLLLLFIFLNVLSGFHSKLFKLLCTIFPPGFKIPHPLYYGFFQVFLFSLLTASGFDLFLNTEIHKNKFFKKAFIFFISVLIIYASIKVLVSVEKSIFYSKIEKSNILISLNSYISMITLHESIWFFKTYFLNYSYFFIQIFFITLISNKKFLSNIIFIFILCNILFYNYNYMYTHTMNPRLNTSDNSPYEKMFMKRYSWPSEHPFFNQKDKIKKLSENNFRFTSSITDLDNIAWFSDSKAFCGYDSKPLIPEARILFEKFYNGWTYQLWAEELPKNLLKNVSVKYYISNKGILDNIHYVKDKIRLLDSKKINLLRYYRKNDPPYWLAKSHEYLIFDFDTPLPLIYFQQNIQKASRDEQLSYLLSKNLTACSYLEENDFNNLFKKNVSLIKKDNKNISAITNLTGITNNKYMSEPNNNYMSEPNNKHISESNNKHIIEPNKINFKNNSVECEIKVNKKGLLVINQVWHKGWQVQVNGKKEKLLKVNFLMQGVKIDPGKNKIKLTFFPPSLKYGLILSFITFIILFFAYLYIYSIQFLDSKKKYLSDSE